MNTLGIIVHLEAKSGNQRGHIGGSTRIKSTKQHPLGTSHHRTFSLAMVTLLTAAFGFTPAAHAQKALTASST